MDKDKPFYGIWLPGVGWLRGKDIFADANRDKAGQVARLIGRGAKVYFIDPSIVDFEALYLERERRSLWHTFKTWFKRKISSSRSSK